MYEEVQGPIPGIATQLGIELAGVGAGIDDHLPSATRFGDGEQRPPSSCRHREDLGRRSHPARPMPKADGNVWVTPNPDSPIGDSGGFDEPAGDRPRPCHRDLLSDHRRVASSKPSAAPGTLMPGQSLHERSQDGSLERASSTATGSESRLHRCRHRATAVVRSRRSSSANTALTNPSSGVRATTPSPFGRRRRPRVGACLRTPRPRDRART